MAAGNGSSLFEGLEVLFVRYACANGLAEFSQSALSSGDGSSCGRRLLGAFLSSEVAAEGSGPSDECPLVLVRIVEVESYGGLEDAASHAYRERQTPRNCTMWKSAGTAYVYLCYGMHHMFNIVTGPENVPAACLVRAVEPLAGFNVIARRRRAGTPKPSRKGPTKPQNASPPQQPPALEATPRSHDPWQVGRPFGKTRLESLRAASGPGCVAQALGVEKCHDNAQLFSPGPLRLLQPPVTETFLKFAETQIQSATAKHHDKLKLEVEIKRKLNAYMQECCWFSPFVSVGPRVGVDYAGACAAWPLRFSFNAHPAVSRPRPPSINCQSPTFAQAPPRQLKQSTRIKKEAKNNKRRDAKKPQPHSAV
eukprot:GHVT01045414.1.p1 GENE.GHVT01045414.1~~GHVT01045414.1.p1  ORF type:complete len:366 (-),score=62.78 GHVT01045414.1:633-1730(-)